MIYGQFDCLFVLFSTYNDDEKLGNHDAWCYTKTYMERLKITN
jgi:hypothetical protein